MIRKLPLMVAALGMALVAMVWGGWAAEASGHGDRHRVIYHHNRPGVGSPCAGLAGCTFVQLWGDPKTGPSEAMFTLKAGTPFAPHWHTSPEHVVGVSGTMLWHVKGHRTYHVGAGDFLYYPGKSVHWGQCAAGADCVYYVYDELPYDIHPVGR